MRRLALLLAALGLLLLAVPAYAQTEIVIEVGGVARGEPGTEVVVDEEQVDPALVGAECSGVLTTENNASVHPGNTLIIETGGQSAEIPGVEDAGGLVLELDGTVTLGETIVFTIRFGPDGITSGGFTLTLTCQEAQETTTTTSAPATTAPAPGGGVSTGAGGAADSGPSPVLFLGTSVVLAVIAAGLWTWRGRTEN